MCSDVKVIETSLPGVVRIEPERFNDERGFFSETWSERRYVEAGITGPFVQDNLSFSHHGVLRGLHFQNPRPQGKLVSVLRGEVFDVAVDIRPDSPTFKQWYGCLLSERNGHQLWVPPGFAHGFCVTGDDALFVYKCTEYYSHADEATIFWNDPEIGIEWPIQGVSVSPRDAAAPMLASVDPLRLPVLSVLQ